MDRENEMKKTYYSTKGYWKGYAAIQKLSKEAGVSKNDAEEWLKKNKHYGRSTYPHQNTSLDPDGQLVNQIRYTKQIYCFFPMIPSEERRIVTHWS